MKCENNFCIYQSDGDCILKEISIDNLGTCADFIYPNIDEKVLNQAKLKLLKYYEKTDNN
ncbi:MAG: hypothetical protein J6C29_02055 [Clostridia bacterium]|nr:hypothetical protein [Clostridia bacterium]